jgi:hypothetical protein
LAATTRAGAAAARSTSAATALNVESPAASKSRSWRLASIERVADQTPTISLDKQLQEIGAQLAWVRDYL